MTTCLGWDGNRDGDGNRDATSIDKAGGVVADGNRNVSNRSEWILVPSEVSLLGTLLPCRRSLPSVPVRNRRRRACRPDRSGYRPASRPYERVRACGRNAGRRPRSPPAPRRPDNRAQCGSDRSAGDIRQVQHHVVGQLSLRDPPSHRVYSIRSRLPSPSSPMPGIFVTSLSSPSLAIWIWECITHPQFERQNDVSFAESRGQRKTPGWQDRAPLLNGFCAYRSQDRSGIARGSLGTGLPV